MDDHCHLPLCEAAAALIEKQGKSETDGLRCEKRVSEKIADETTAIIGHRSVEMQSDSMAAQESKIFSLFHHKNVDPLEVVALWMFYECVKFVYFSAQNQRS